MNPLHIYTDGGCQLRTGIGGWSCIILQAGDRNAITLTGGLRNTTNNEMELTAILAALRWLEGNGRPQAIIHSDSRYALSCVFDWSKGWENRGWKKAGGPIRNLEIIKEAAMLRDQLKVSPRWVRGHNGDFWNEQADMAATIARKRAALTGGFILTPANTHHHETPKTTTNSPT